MPNTTRGLPPFVPVPGWFVAQASRLVARVFPRPANAAALRPFVVSVVLQGGPSGPLCVFPDAPGWGGRIALANPPTFRSIYPTN